MSRHKIQRKQHQLDQVRRQQSTQATSATTDHTLLQLQRSVGNRSIQQLLAQRVGENEYAPWMKNIDTFVEALEENHYLLQQYAQPGVNVVNVHGTQRNLRQLRVNRLHPQLQAQLTSMIQSVHIRPQTPRHKNEEGNLPGQMNVADRYFEMGIESGGGIRLIVDVQTNDIYFSYHYGGNQNLDPNTRRPRTDSPFVRMTGLSDLDAAVPRYTALLFDRQEVAYNRSAEQQQRFAKALGAPEFAKLSPAQQNEYYAIYRNRYNGRKYQDMLTTIDTLYTDAAAANTHQVIKLVKLINAYLQDMDAVPDSAIHFLELIEPFFNELDDLLP